MANVHCFNKGRVKIWARTLFQMWPERLSLKMPKAIGRKDDPVVNSLHWGLEGVGPKFWLCHILLGLTCGKSLNPSLPQVPIFTDGNNTSFLPPFIDWTYLAGELFAAGIMCLHSAWQNESLISAAASTITCLVTIIWVIMRSPLKTLPRSFFFFSRMKLV